jgi:hypothetical protein
MISKSIFEILIIPPLFQMLSFG